MSSCIRRPRAAIGTLRYTAELLAGALAAVAALATPLAAQNFPERTITLIVPFAAGGASDVSSRIMGEAMSKSLGQTVVIENVAGAAGVTGIMRGKNATPDGYTIGFGHMGTHAVAKIVNPKLPYDPLTAFDYLGIHLTTPNLLIMRKTIPATNLQELIAFAKQKGPELRMGHNGVGTLSHLTCLLFFQMINTAPTYVIYRGFGQTINDVVSGAIDGTCDLVVSAGGHITGGSVKGFGVTDDVRSPMIPDVPTSKEGGLPAFNVNSWLGMYTPKGLPPAVLAKLRAAFEAAIDDPDVQKRFIGLGGTVPKADMRGPDRMLATIKADIEKWGAIVATAGGITEETK